MNTENLLTLYKRAMQYCVAAYSNGEPDEIHIQEDGTLTAVWSAYDRYHDDDYEYFCAEKLTEDLDVIYAERKERDEAERIKQEEYNNQQRIITNRQEKERRRSEYLKLKKEFEGEKKVK